MATSATLIKLSSLFSVLFFPCFTDFSSVLSFAEASHSAGYSVNLIHRDSPASPFYNPLETQFDRFYNAYNRSLTRINHFKRSLSSSPTVLQSPMLLSGGEFFMNISIGTPPITLLGMTDSGSDLTWVQCKPCTKCYTQKPPLFDPQKSSTYENVPCGSDSCSALDAPVRVCDQELNQCGYNYTYGDGSFTAGNVALENFTFSSTAESLVSLTPKLVFGCTHSTAGYFDPIGAGIIGLGGGPVSLVSQLGSAINQKFAYCLASSTETSKIIFGTDGKFLSLDTVSTPLVAKDPSAYYYVTLEAISVGNQRLPYQGRSVANNGNIIIDSGTTITGLDPEFFGVLASALEKAIPGQRSSDPGKYFSACFKGVNETSLPIITMHFSGADVKLSSVNTFTRVQQDLVCFTMIPSGLDIAIYGNLAMTNFLVGYDLGKQTVSFSPMDCSKY